MPIPERNVRSKKLVAVLATIIICVAAGGRVISKLNFDIPWWMGAGFLLLVMLALIWLAAYFMEYQNNYLSSLEQFFVSDGYVKEPPQEISGEPKNLFPLIKGLKRDLYYQKVEKGRRWYARKYDLSDFSLSPNLFNQQSSGSPKMGQSHQALAITMTFPGQFSGWFKIVPRTSYLSYPNSQFQIHQNPFEKEFYLYSNNPGSASSILTNDFIAWYRELLSLKKKPQLHLEGDSLTLMFQGDLTMQSFSGNADVTLLDKLQESMRTAATLLSEQK